MQFECEIANEDTKTLRYKNPRQEGIAIQSFGILQLIPTLHICNDSKFIKQIPFQKDMMTSSNGNIFRVTGHLRGEFTGRRWIPRTKASDAELWCFLWSASE